jgi:hypothetical protein
MKFLTIFTVSLLAFSQICKADLFNEMTGKWKQDGTDPGVKVTSVYKRYQKKGLIATTTIIIPGQAIGTAVTRYYDNGKVEGIITNGILETRIIGTWRVSGKTLKDNVTLSGSWFPTLTQNDTTTLVSANRINSITTSNQGRFTGSLTRIR